MFTKPGILLFLFLIVSLTKGQDCLSILTCKSPCSWYSCCTQLYCTDCYRIFSCEIEIITGSASWCTVQVNDPLTPSLINVINITFESSNDCTSCVNGETMCCRSDDTVIPINCSTMSIYAALTSSSQSSDVYSDSALVTSSLITPWPTVSSAKPLIGTYFLLTPTHFTTSTINTVSITSSVPATPSTVPVTSTITMASIVVPTVVGTVLLILLVVITSAIAISCVIICKKHSKGKQTEATQKQNWNIDMAECEAYGKLEVNCEKIDMTACSAYGTLQTLQNVVDPQYEDVTAI